MHQGCGCLLLVQRHRQSKACGVLIGSSAGRKPPPRYNHCSSDWHAELSGLTICLESIQASYRTKFYRGTSKSEVTEWILLRRESHVCMFSSFIAGKNKGHSNINSCQWGFMSLWCNWSFLFSLFWIETNKKQLGILQWLPVLLQASLKLPTLSILNYKLDSC